MSRPARDPRDAVGRRLVRGALALGAVVAACDLAVLVAHGVLARRVGGARLALPGVPNGREVTPRVLRGGAPTAQGYGALAAAGVTTVVDLRAERGDIDEARLAALGLHRIALPVRDGQAPPFEAAARLDEVLARAPGRVFVHCGAGVGRTGAVVGAWEVRARGVPPRTAAGRALAVGPPSLEQLAYVLAGGRSGAVVAAVRGVSRVVDAPRRVLARARQRRHPRR